MNDKAYDIPYLPIDMVDTVGFGINYNGIAIFDEFTDTDSVVDSVLVNDTYSELRLMVYQDEDRNILDTYYPLRFVEEATDRDGNTYYEWSDGNWTFRNTITGQDECTYTLAAVDTLDPAVYITLETQEIVPIPEEFLSNIPVDGQTIDVNKDGQLEVISSISLQDGYGITVSGNTVNVDNSVIPSITTMNSALATKQNTLTAGAGVDITNNVISTGT